MRRREKRGTRISVSITRVRETEREGREGRENKGDQRRREELSIDHRGTETDR